MAESHKFKNLDDLGAVFPDVPWRADAAGNVAIFDAKADEYVPVEAGQFVVSIGDRFEVADEEPAKAKPSEAPKKSDDKPHESGLEGAEQPSDS